MKKSSLAAPTVVNSLHLHTSEIWDEETRELYESTLKVCWRKSIFISKGVVMLPYFSYVLTPFFQIHLGLVAKIHS